jgi:glutamyl-tRNA reductase
MLFLLGVNHRSAPLSLRERMACQETEIGDRLRGLTGLPGIEEAMILSTCNRVEILLRADGPVAGRLREFVTRHCGVSGEELDRYSYSRSDTDAVQHLFRVAAGLDSMVLGEPQILGQVKQAYAAAREAGTVGSILDHLLRRTLSAAKRIRTETGISRHAVSIAYAAVELARKIFGSLDKRSALLLGAGKMGELVATHLVGNGVDSFVVASRTFNHAAEFVARFGGTACNWDDSFEHLSDVDIVVCGTAAPGTVLDRAAVQKAVRKRRGRPLFLIDIAVPRDVEPDVNQLDNVYLYDIDDLQNVVDANLEERRREARLAEERIEQEVETFERWLESLKITPTIVALREAMHGMGEAELARFRGRLGDLDAEQEKQVRRLVRALIQKILHRPVRHLKGSAARGDASAVAALYAKVFGVEAEGVEANGDASAEPVREETDH